MSVCLLEKKMEGLLGSDPLSVEQLQSSLTQFKEGECLEEYKKHIQPICTHLMEQFVHLPYDEVMLQKGCLLMEFMSELFDIAMKDRINLECFNLFWPEQILTKFSLLLKEANQYTGFVLLDTLVTS